LALKVQLVVLVNAFVMVSTVWSVSCLLFFYSYDRYVSPPVPYGVDATVSADFFILWRTYFDRLSTILSLF